MKAIVAERAGGPDVLALKDVPIPTPAPGHVQIKIKAFGLNQSEIITRTGANPRLGTEFPRILGIECVGIVEAAPETDFAPGQVVAAVVGGLGRAYDGSYAEYTLVPAEQVIPLKTGLDWPTLGAVPEMFLTAWVSLTDGLDAKRGESLLVRGGSSSVGLAAIALGKEMGLSVAATTRSAHKESALREVGADHVLIDDGAIAPRLRQIFPDGVQRVLELVGADTLIDSLSATAMRGAVCVTGNLGNGYAISNFTPMGTIPYCAKLTAASTMLVNRAFAGEALQTIVSGIEAGRIKTRIDRTFTLEQVPEAHRYIESGKAAGKLVVVMD